MRTLVLFFLMTISVLQVSAQEAVSSKANYALAAKYSPKKLKRLVFSTEVKPHWLKNSDRFWYVYETSEGKKWYLADAVKKQKREMFDRAKLAAELTRIVKDPFDAEHLPIDSLKLTKNEQSIQFEVKSTQDVPVKDTSLKKGTIALKEKKIYAFEYNLETNSLTQLSDFTKPKAKPEWASVSPDGKVIVFARNFNLYSMDRAGYEKALLKENDSTITETQLTTDGFEYFGYGDTRNETNVDREKKAGKRKPVFMYWSPDSRHFAIIKTDTRKVKDLWVINSIAEPRPTLETYKYQMPGEKEIQQDYVILFDVALKKQQYLKVSLFKDQTVALWPRPSKKSEMDDELRPLVWQGDNERFYLTRTSRDLKNIDVLAVDVATGSAKAVIKENMNTYLEVRRIGIINGGKELIHWSERDGWAHFYLYDENGKLQNQITSGAFHCEDIEGIDEKKRVLYFSANGREPGEDPYYMHLYRINFDGTGMQLLNAGQFEHDMSLNDNNSFFVDNSSRVNTVPVAALYNTLGQKVMDLEKTDLASLFATGYKFPEIFKVKSDDGISDLYGVIYKPYNFDSTKKYPIVEYVYPGPQTEAVNKAFMKPADRIDRLAQIGIIVVTVGNRGGSPSRSKWYHNYGYGNLRDYGLADKKAAIEQLADRYSYIDINRVGIHGHSGGGFMSTAAMLIYPDFYKVAVSSSGNHDNSIYNRWWSEKHHGVKELIDDKGDTSFAYTIEKNPDLAKNLKGHLMLTTGDIDNNVSPANTTRVVNALIKANKRFDMVVLPGQRHGYGDMQEWFFWCLADYYSKWLLGDFSQPVDIIEMNREKEMTGK